MSKGMTEQEIKSKLIGIAARRAQGTTLGALYGICEGQKTISTMKLMRLLDEIAETDKNESYEIRKIVDGMRFL